MPDPRDEIHDCAQALAGLRDMVTDIARQNGPGFEHTGAIELAALLDMVASRLTPAAEAVQHLVPRDYCA